MRSWFGTFVLVTVLVGATVACSPAVTSSASPGATAQESTQPTATSTPSPAPTPTPSPVRTAAPSIVVTAPLVPSDRFVGGGRAVSVDPAASTLVALIPFSPQLVKTTGENVALRVDSKTRLTITVRGGPEKFVTSLAEMGLQPGEGVVVLISYSSFDAATTSYYAINLQRTPKP